MQMKRAEQLKKEWGGKPCTHPAFAKAYDLGRQTGDYLCKQCGTSFTLRAKKEIEAARPT